MPAPAAGAGPALDADALRTARWRAQRLAPRAGADPAALVAWLGAVQAQDPRAAALAVRVRRPGLDPGAVERARDVDRSVVRTWALRGTLHLVATADVRWLLRLLEPRHRATRARRWRQLGLDEATWARARRALLGALGDGPRSRAELGAALAAAGVDPSGQRLPHLLARAAGEGELCDGPDAPGGERTWVRLADWVDAPAGPDGDDAAAELARRHLAAHAPAEPRDLAAWSGLTVGEARAAWASIARELREVATAAGPRWLLAADAPALLAPAGGGAAPAVRLLPAYDASLLGWHDRTWTVPSALARAVNAGGGLVRPTVAVDGRVVGTWWPRVHAGAEPEVDLVGLPGDALPDHARAGLDAEVADVVRFLGAGNVAAASSGGRRPAPRRRGDDDRRRDVEADDDPRRRAHRPPAT